MDDIKQTHYSMQETCEIIGCTTRPILRWIDSGDLKARKIGECCWVEKSQLSDHLRVFNKHKKIMARKQRERERTNQMLSVFDEYLTDYEEEV